MSAPIISNITIPPAAVQAPERASRMQSARSSRRKVGSTAPQVVLGGGAGVLGSSSKDVQYVPPPFAASSSSSAATGLPPVQYPSPSSQSFPSPISPLFPNMYRAPSPLPPQLTDSNATTKSTSGADRDVASAPTMSSVSSLSTAASTSSRTLKTPHSKMDQHHHMKHMAHPSIVSSSDSHDSQSPSNFESDPLPPLPKEFAAMRRGQSDGIAVRSRDMMRQSKVDQKSPTPLQRTVKTGNRTSPTDTARPSPPPFSNAVPKSTTAGQNESSIEPRRPPRPRGTTPPHLDLGRNTKVNQRLSQDWIQVDFPGPSMEPERREQGKALQHAPDILNRKPSGLPGAVMVPMKGSQPQLDLDGSLAGPTSRPMYERSNTAPPLSPPPPTQQDEAETSRPQRKGRGSLDQFRSNSSAEIPMSQRSRKISHSTPPSAVLESAPGSNIGRLNPFRTAPKASSDAVDAGKRPSAEMPGLVAPRRDDVRALQQEQQRSLGVASGRGSRDEGRAVSAETERKVSGLSMKKSTGALKALFNRGVSGKGKERSETPPPMPVQPQYPAGRQDDVVSELPYARRGSSASPNRALGRGKRRSPSPGSPTPPRGLSSEGAGATRPHPQRIESDIMASRPSFTSERANYPAPPLQRTRSHGVQPGATSAPMIGSRSEPQPGPKKIELRSPVGLFTQTQPPPLAQRMPDRDLPPLPLTPLNSALSVGPNSVETSEAKSSGTSLLSFATARESPLSASDDSRSMSLTAGDVASTSPAQLPPSASLHLLQLPSLDLEFDLSFDKIGMSPSTPRRLSPGKARRSPRSPHSPSPQRSLTTKIPSTRVSPVLRRQNSDRILDKSDRRRSKSFDGPTAGQTLANLWRDVGPEGSFTSPSMARYFASSSNSAPMFSRPLEPTSSDDSMVSMSNSASSSSTTTPQPSTHQHLIYEDSMTCPSDSVKAIPDHLHRSMQRNGCVEYGSEPSSSDHARTPSNTSSMHDTESPSPPKTPPQHARAQIRDYGFTYESSPLSAPTPKAITLALGHESDPESSFARPIMLSSPPTIPLPPAPVPQIALSPVVSQEDHAVPFTPKNRVVDLAPSPPRKLVIRAVSDDKVLPTEPAGPLVAGVAPPRTRPPTTLPDSPKAAEDDDSHLRPVGGPTVITVRPARAWRPSIGLKSKSVSPDDRSLRGLVQDLETIVNSFRGPASLISSSERCNLVRSQLLPLLGEIEKRPYMPKDTVTNQSLREVAFEWAESLLYELRVEQAANERGACLEGLSAVMESPCLSQVALKDDAQHTVRFTDLMIKCMKFVMGKLGAKGVFHNTLLFSGRFLAFAFFRIPHVAEQLVTVLQLPRGALTRFTRAGLMGPAVPPHARPQYPKHLSPLCLDTCASYTSRLAVVSADFRSDEEREAFLFKPGNWLRRWQSDDSELFPAFYRAYHRQLAGYLAPAIEYYETLGEPVPLQILLRAPGYAHLATIFAKKSHAYILGSINAVTTSSASQGFDATESAGLKASQKPPVLETANRRLTETISTLINTHIAVPDTRGKVVECDGQQLWSSILDHWTKTLIGKTSLYAPKGVFSLFDLLDGIVDPPHDPVTGERRLREVSLLDVPHLIHVIRIVLNQAEHALTIVKVVAFVFTHWEVLTARSEDRKELCLGLLLEKSLFERLTLFWSQSVRSYVLRLVVFRLGHVHTTKEDGVNHDVEIDSVRLLQTRLERIRKRYDELEPKDANTPIDRNDSPYLSSTFDGLPRSKSTITMITDSPRGPSNKAERLLGLGFGQMDNKGLSALEVEDHTRMGKAKGWLKKSFANKKKGRGGGGASPALSGSATSSPNNSPRMSPSPQMENSGSLSSPLLGIKERKSPRPSFESSHTKGQGAKSNPPAVLSLDSPEMEEYSPPGASHLPTISTSSPSETTSPGVGLGPSGIAFEFELPTMSPRSDTFDPTPTPSSPRRNSQPPSPHSPHMSRSFSKRSSLLPPNTASILASGLSSPISRRNDSTKYDKGEEGYPKKWHAYAIRMLAELEDAQKEYDEWWSPGGVGTVDGAPPRLTVAWPFHEGDE
ncbi:hypothetical protein BD324DRAFT_653488 [Kockovaella imperatae]|uniref:Uncharacterized protein n=1 Tax=Kockovaella imperatae TaxID=4999 RepID=A0A1Y1U855_9TREE|nr:hypothetical protein BD324DRAFT_653488 [Kockovaella imperatae]ORX34220.1 hypothetical protein BD324DRAFT_653488 [Kockovaella imperatae]